MDEKYCQSNKKEKKLYIIKQKVTRLYWVVLNNLSPLIFNYSVRGSRFATSAYGNFAKSRKAAFVAKLAKAK